MSIDDFLLNIKKSKKTKNKGFSNSNNKFIDISSSPHILKEPQERICKFFSELSFIEIDNPKYKDSYLTEDNIQHFFDIYQNFEIESISDITANECVIDISGNPISDINNIRIDVSEVNDWMLNELNKNPTDLYKLSSRKFEELIAEIFMRKGYKVELTPATRDGGKDIYVAQKDDLGSFLYIVECKKYTPTHRVGVNILRDLYGVLSKERATYGIAVTTSYFSKPAIEFQQELKFQMSLKDFDSIKQWLHDVAN